LVEAAAVVKEAGVTSQDGASQIPASRVFVIPAQAGIRFLRFTPAQGWIPACAGMTVGARKPHAAATRNLTP
jgi:hypothetical protein